MSAKNLADGNRVELRLHEGATQDQYRELGMFVRDCVDRIERDLDRADRWEVKIAPNSVCYCCEVIVQHDDVVLQATGNGFDGAVAGWEAFKAVETLLRDSLIAHGSDAHEASCDRC
jgi:hypothetical protein